MNSFKLKVINLGLTDYQETRELQIKIQREIIEENKIQSSDPNLFINRLSDYPCHLILCSHPPTITIGRSGSRQNIIADETVLLKNKTSIYEIERGGDVTFHSPEQFIAYPIIDLGKKKKDVGWYIRGLEEVIIRVLAEYKINAQRIEGKTGVWVKQTSPTPTTELIIQENKTESNDTVRFYQEYRKISSIGVRISRWVTLHGISINIKDNSYGFNLINPCGMPEAKITSIEEEIKKNSSSSLHLGYTFNDISDRFVGHFCDFFHYETTTS